MPCVSQACQMMLPFGQAHAPASHSASQESSAGQKMSGTSGRCGSGSSASADLQSFLASKLQAVLPSPGSMLYLMTWKAQVTPAQRQICALLASARRISGNAFSGWPTATSTDAKRYPSQNFAMRNITLNHVAVLACWPTPASTDYKGGYFGGRMRNGKWSTDRLDVTAQLAIRGGGADWIECRDGKHRPVEPRLEPLADGISCRVGRLRAYGNAIVPQVAAAFVRALMPIQEDYNNG